MAKISLSGVDAIINRLNEINANVNKLTNKALQNAGEPVLEDAKANVSVGKGVLKEELKISAVKTKDGIKFILVGIDKKDSSKIFYGKFLEFGTSKMPAKPFLVPAYLKNKKQIMDIIKDTLKEGLK
ncbi:HK97 gp10 family phage protein [Clostridium tagluense]|uniref:HK97-gp10 family putative phage morphogenesis protein n=1 Tax=Clostridium tagluense TaxID=360422 RepID=UPI001CF25F03|nr:HK97-gp10 family putative phage morphogenesis protein [Clostridium tagluense]MCB2311609.1 HK97 gp10 family phage protein [Clostridium tagluense]MCB2316333.1 HK97 gp10 family phage protein [Clostridium tagluense]MCB2321283.1 HK97 gp10 family phage protein [Clostridium tagluense]MCB2326202.1 HK97 gp10 family phage protein [Clostridium tagluense]MCB2331019.1 HK97 gp10 family phage protein [Clostridium tagluense]